MNDNDIKYKKFKIRKTTKILIFVVFVSLIISASLVFFNILPMYILIIPVIIYMLLRKIYFNTSNKK